MGNILRKIIKMNKRTVISELNKIANELDYSGKHTEADAIANVMKSLSQTKPLNMENGEAVMGKGEFYPDEKKKVKKKTMPSSGGSGQPPIKPPFDNNFGNDKKPKKDIDKKNKNEKDIMKNKIQIEYEDY